MNLKQYMRYQMDFSGKWAPASAALTGASFFLRILYYFVFTDITTRSAVEIVFAIILPLLLFAGYFVLLGVLKWNAPGIYGILGCALCLFLVISGFFSGSILRILLGIIFYLIIGVGLLATVGGYLPGRLPVTLIILSVLTVRIFFFLSGSHSAAEFCMEASMLCLLAAMFALVRGLKAVLPRDISD